MAKLVLLIVLALILNGCGAGHSYTVATDSMSPTLKAGDTIFANTFEYKFSSPQRGDVIIVRAPDGEKESNGQTQMFPKRVIGVGGDKIQLAACKVYVNEQVVMQNVRGVGECLPGLLPDFGPIVVPANEYFLVGDNLPNSRDSRQWKHSTVTIDYIVGKVTTVKDKDTGKIRSF
jgi:signal peptidase I